MAFALRGQIYSDQGKLDGALADLNEAVHLDPTSADAYVFGRWSTRPGAGPAVDGRRGSGLARERYQTQAAEVRRESEPNLPRGPAQSSLGQGEEVTHHLLTFMADRR